MSPKPSNPQPRSRGLGTLLAVVLVGGILAAILAPEAVQALLPGAGSLVARAWSAASPAAAGHQTAAGRLSSADAQALADRAEEAWQSGHWAEVAESLTALAAAGPRDRRQDDLLYEAHINLGWAELGKGRPEEAQAHLARALEVRPGGQEALEGLRLARQPVAEVASSSPPQSSASAEAICHIVQPGDTLFALARRFGTTVEAIKAANGLPCSKIVVGQKLLIPVCVQPKPPVCVPVCPTPEPKVVCVPVCPTPAPKVVCVPVCPTPAPKVVCVPVCPPVVCVPVCPPVVCAPACPPVVCAPVCPTPVCVPLCDP